MNYAGKHCYGDLILDQWPGDEKIFQACQEAIDKSKMMVESCTRKQFKPHGMTSVWILSESHFTLHTYPEHGYLTVDCYTCGNEGDPQAAIDSLVYILQPAKTSIGFLFRGKFEGAQ